MTANDVMKTGDVTKNFLKSCEYHPAGDVTRVSVMPRKVTVKFGIAENRCR